MHPQQTEVRQNPVPWMSVYVIPLMYSRPSAYMCHPVWNLKSLHDSCIFRGVSGWSRVTRVTLSSCISSCIFCPTPRRRELMCKSASLNRMRRVMNVIFCEVYDCECWYVMDNRIMHLKLNAFMCFFIWLYCKGYVVFSYLILFPKRNLFVSPVSVVCFL